ncbi:MAG: hypothetical protein ABIT83_23415 [Massilia sp.]
MPLPPIISQVLSRLSRACGFETLDAFPPAHQHARTRWNPAYFDIASDLSGEQIERSLCESIANTPLIFAHITHPTPRMQRVLMAVIDTRVRRACGVPSDLVTLLIKAYEGSATQEGVPGLRAVIYNSAHLSLDEQVHEVLAFLREASSTFDLISPQPAARLAGPSARAAP